MYTGPETGRSLTDTLTSVFVAPVLENPMCTTLILGVAWFASILSNDDMDTMWVLFFLGVSGQRKHCIHLRSVARICDEAWACEDRFDTDTEYIATKLAEHLGLFILNLLDALMI